MDDIKTGSQKAAAPPLLLASSPHIVSPVNSRALMRNVLIALAPVSAFSVVIFGLPALINIVVSVVAAVASESLFRLATRQQVRANDLSAVITGLLLALVVPPSMPPWMTALGSVFAIVVAKEFFGGLGANVFNPALVGRAFLLMSFPAAMTTWHAPNEGLFPLKLDATSGASLLGKVAESGGKYWEEMRETFMTSEYLKTVKEMFFGFHEGSSGETSAPLILAACIFLLATKTIDWRAPFSMLATAFVVAIALGHDPLIAVLSGGLLFGAVFMTTDYVTAPLTPWGKVIFGIGAGLLTMLIRAFGTYPEGVCYSILIMNCAVPFLNKILPRKYGFVPKKKGAAK